MKPRKSGCLLEIGSILLVMGIVSILGWAIALIATGTSIVLYGVWLECRQS